METRGFVNNETILSNAVLVAIYHYKLQNPTECTTQRVNSSINSNVTI